MTGSISEKKRERLRNFFGRIFADHQQQSPFDALTLAQGRLLTSDFSPLTSHVSWAE
jgi:hypothetical protein